jgi:antitoxin VapB
MEQAAEAVEPGMTEHEISAVIAHFIRASGLVPNVNLVATDERIFKFRHPIPTAGELERYAMLVTCASLGGLVCSLTRFVHFGPMPEDLKRKQQATADIDTAVNFATRPDRTLGEVFADLQQAYASAGFAEEWKLHHQGGPTGYANRERVAVPGDDTRVLENQAFAWNPSITGAKSEDTILVTEEGFEVLTGHSGDWPTVIGHAAEGELPRAGCLVK